MILLQAPRLQKEMKVLHDKLSILYQGRQANLPQMTVVLQTDW